MADLTPDALVAPGGATRRRLTDLGDPKSQAAVLPGYSWRIGRATEISPERDA